jgi:ATP-dependent protease ClpP protease subunit
MRRIGGFMGIQVPVQVLHQAPNPTAFPAYVSFSAEIMPFTTESLIALLSNLSNQGFKEVYLMMSTLGGSVMHGMNLYNVLRAFPFKLTTHNVGNVDSIGNAVFLAGEERYACPHSTFMFHGVAAQLPALNAEAKFLRERLDSITSDIKRIGNILVERTRIKREDVDALFAEASTKDAAFAVGCGIVHDVRDVKIPVGASIFSLVFQR